MVWYGRPESEHTNLVYLSARKHWKCWRISAEHNLPDLAGPFNGYQSSLFHVTTTRLGQGEKTQGVLQMKMLSILNLLLGAVTVAPGIASAAGNGPLDYTVTISTPHETIAAGDAVPIHVVMTNVSDHDLGIDRLPVQKMADCEYRIEVQGRNGLVVYEDAYRCIGPLPLGRDTNFFYLKPGEKLENDTSITSIYRSDAKGEDLINESRVFDFSEPGKYVVQFLRTDVYGGKKSYVPSNKLTITVLPGNAESEAAHAHHFSIAISTPSEVIKSGDAVLIHVVETNISDEEITVPTPPDPTQAKTHYIIAVNGPNHTWAGGGIYTGPNMKTLKPGEQNEEFATLAGSPFDFSKPGEYVIQFFTTDGDGSNPRSVKSNKITINVTD
jgi:hypothetical protein